MPSRYEKLKTEHFKLLMRTKEIPDSASSYSDVWALFMHVSTVFEGTW